MSTVRDLISGALRLIGAVDAYSPLAENEASDGLEALNGLIGSLSLDGLVVYSVTKEDFNLVAGTGTYTMGPGGTFNSVRPVRIETAKYKVGDQEYDLHILNDQENQGIDLRTLGGFPEYLYSDNAFPLASITLWPVPSVAEKVTLWSWKPITAFTAVTDVISLPPGYERMLKYNLALEQAPEYAKEPPASVVAIARESKAAIQRMNIQPVYLECDSALLAGNRRSSMSDFLGGK
ncbi:MAG: hypothetical protein ABFE01_17375 [Phycisphaerales bacterium]